MIELMQNPYYVQRLRHSKGKLLLGYNDDDDDLLGHTQAFCLKK